MKRRNFIQSSVLTTAALALGASEVGAWLAGPAKKLQTVTLTGDGLQRGRAHGELLRPRIQEIIGLWHEVVGTDTGVSPKKYFKGFLEQARFTAAIKRWTPGIYEEVRGIAEGAAMDFGEVYAFQLLDEEWWYRESFKLERSPESEHCTGVGVAAKDGRPTLLAQTMDIESFKDGFQILLHLKYAESPLEVCVLSSPGLVGLTGMNNQSIGVSCNTVSQLDQSEEGLPVAFVLRGLLEQPDFARAAGWVKRVPHASGQNYGVGWVSDLASFECSAHSVVRFVPPESFSCYYHTNHPLANPDQAMFRERQKKMEVSKEPGNSEVRLESVRRQLAAEQGPLDVNGIKSILSSHESSEYPVCRHKGEPGDGMAYAAVIMELAQAPKMHVAPGPPCSTEFETFAF